MGPALRNRTEEDGEGKAGESLLSKSLACKRGPVWEVTHRSISASKEIHRSCWRRTTVICTGIWPRVRRVRPPARRINVAAQGHMIELAGGSADGVVPGHDALQFQKFLTRIK
jgi:hypothetical protein